MSAIFLWCVPIHDETEDRALSFFIHIIHYYSYIFLVPVLSEGSYKVQNGVQFRRVTPYVNLINYTNKSIKLHWFPRANLNILPLPFPWQQLDNHGNHVVASEESAINIPAVAAAHVIKRYAAQAPDEISLEVSNGCRND